MTSAVSNRINVKSFRIYSQSLKEKVSRNELICQMHWLTDWQVNWVIVRVWVRWVSASTCQQGVHVTFPCINLITFCSVTSLHAFIFAIKLLLTFSWLQDLESQQRTNKFTSCIVCYNLFVVFFIKEWLNSFEGHLQPTSNQVSQWGVKVASNGFGGGWGGGRNSCHACGHGSPAAPRGAAPGALWRYSRHQQVA